MRRCLGYAALGSALFIALDVFVIAIGAPLWLVILALAAGVVVWVRYLWKYTRWWDPVREATARRRAAAEKQRDSDHRKPPRP